MSRIKQLAATAAMAFRALTAEEAETVGTLIRDNRDKWQTAIEKPTLCAWFGGQAVRALNGNANPQNINAFLLALANLNHAEQEKQ